MKKTISKIIIITLSSIIVAFGVFTGVRCCDLNNTTEAAPLSLLDAARLEGVLSSEYSERYDVLKPLPYKIPQQELNVWAESAIIINADN